MNSSLKILKSAIISGEKKYSNVLICSNCNHASTYADWISNKGRCPNCGHEGWSIGL